jgi:hypothetical protein
MIGGDLNTHSFLNRLVRVTSSRRTIGLILLLVSLAWAGLGAVSAQTIIDNKGTGEANYLNGRSEVGLLETEYFVSSGGRAVLGEKGVEYGTGTHRVKNVDGLGSYLSIAPSQSEFQAVDKLWVLGFRVAEMSFHWDSDAARLGQIVIVVDSLKPHSSVVTNGGVFKLDQPNKEYNEHSVGSQRISLVNGQIVLEEVSNLPYVATKSYLGQGSPFPNALSNEFSATGEPAGCDRKVVIGLGGVIGSQDILVRLARPMEGQPETLVRSATLVNEFRDHLKFMEILGPAGGRTSAVFFDKGQSVCFDGGGNPISGSGRFEIDPGPAGQSVTGWLGLTSLSVRTKVSNTTSFKFLPKNAVAKWGMTAVDFVAINPWGRWGAVAGVGLVALVIVVIVKRSKR